MTQAVAQVENPFAVARAPAPTNPLAEAGQQREIAEVQASMIIAKKFPRDAVAAMDRILNACTRPALAEAALYEYARGGTAVTGPSIRLAEAIAQQWGNLQFGIRELDQRGGESTVEAFAWDVETNTRQVKVFQVPHLRHTRKGAYKLEDPRDIYELVANQGARRLRACILGVIPGDVIDAAVNQCEVTLKTQADTSPEAVKKMLAAFGEIGVTREQIEKRIQRRIDAITAAALVALRKIYNSIRDGMSVPADWFEVTAPAGADGASAPATGAGRLRAAAERAKPAAKDPEPHDNEQHGRIPFERLTLADLTTAMRGAKTAEIRAEVLDLARGLPEAEAAKLRAIYDELEAPATAASVDDERF